MRRGSRSQGSASRHKNQPREQDPQSRRPSAIQRAGFIDPRSSVDVLIYELVEKIDIEKITDNITANLRKTVRDALLDHVREAISSADPHRTWLAEVDRIAQNTEDIDELRKTIAAYLRQSGITRVEDFPGNEKSFVIRGDPNGDEFKVSQPAYIDSASHRTILSGRANAVRRPNSAASAEYSEDVQ